MGGRWVDGGGRGKGQQRRTWNLQQKLLLLMLLSQDKKGALKVRMKYEKNVNWKKFVVFVEEREKNWLQIYVKRASNKVWTSTEKEKKKNEWKFEKSD